MFTIPLRLRMMCTIHFTISDERLTKALVLTLFFIHRIQFYHQYDLFFNLTPSIELFFLARRVLDEP